MNKDFYIKLIANVFNTFRPLIIAAPTRKGWDPIFKRSIESGYQVKQRRNAALQAIVEEAAVFGYDMADMIPKDDTE